MYMRAQFVVHSVSVFEPLNFFFRIFSCYVNTLRSTTCFYLHPFSLLPHTSHETMHHTHHIQSKSLPSPLSNCQSNICHCHTLHFHYHHLHQMADSKLYIVINDICYYFTYPLNSLLPCQVNCLTQALAVNFLMPVPAQHLMLSPVLERMLAYQYLRVEDQ